MRLLLLWLWFVSQVVAGPCLTTPEMTVTENLYQAGGLYTPGHVQVLPHSPTVIIIHEFSHHLDWACRISERPVGRAFAMRAGFDPAEWWTGDLPWGERPEEMFAATLTWMLTGRAVGPVQYGATRPLERRLLADG